MTTQTETRTSTWNIDKTHSIVEFAVKHLVVTTVKGHFREFEGTALIDEANPENSSVTASIDVASIDTRVADRDAHLKSPDFFDAGRYPTITFRSTQVARAGEDRLRVTGDLTLHGVTRPVTLEVSTTPAVKGMSGETRRGFSATTQIARKDFGLTWNKVVEAGPAVGDEVTITLDLEAVKAQPRAAAN